MSVVRSPIPLSSAFDKIATLFLLVLLPVVGHSQFPARLKDGLKTYLTPDSTTYLKLNFVTQVWVRFNENNPGSTVNGQLESNTYDVGLRRTRVVLSGQLTDRVFFFVQFGQNNIGYLSPRKTGAFFHDVAGEYALVKKKLSLGFGLNGWNGPGRFANSSVPSILALDPPLFQETTNDVNDQFVRKMGIYAKGKLGRLDYRLSASKPFVTQTASVAVDPLSTYSSYSMMIPRQAYQGYFMYQFWDRESNTGPGPVGTYLGKKKIFNIGTGFVHQDRAMWSKTTVTDTIYHAMNLWAVDIFYDTPLTPKGNALTVYGGYFNYDFGKGYIRNVGESGTLQFYTAVQYAKYDRLNDPMVLIDTGINWLVYGHNSKFTLNYQNRPVYSAADMKVSARRGEWVLQYQVAF